MTVPARSRPGPANGRVSCASALRSSIACGHSATVGWVRVSLVALLVACVFCTDAGAASYTASGHVAATDFVITVHSGPRGETPSGSLDVSGFYNFHATLTCSNAAGGTGVSGFAIDNGPAAGQGFLASASDGLNGQPTGVDYSGLIPAPPLACPIPGDSPPAFTLSGGGGPLTSGALVLSGPLNPRPPRVSSFAVGTPAGIAQAPSGAHWFTDPSANRVGYVDNAIEGAPHFFDLPIPGSGVSAIAADSCAACGRAWFVESQANKIGRVDPSGAISEQTIPTPASGSTAITGDGLGNGAWFAEGAAHKLGHIDEGGLITETALPGAGSGLLAVSAATGAGGVWFLTSGMVGYLDSAGQVLVRHDLRTDGSSGPGSISADPSGGAWFLEPSAARVTHINADGRTYQFAIPSAGSGATSISSGLGRDGSPGGAWFTEPGLAQIGYVSPTAGVSEFELDGGSAPQQITGGSPLSGGPAGYTSDTGVWWTDPAHGSLGAGEFPWNAQVSGFTPTPYSQIGFAASAARLRQERSSFRLGVVLRDKRMRVSAGSVRVQLLCTLGSRCDGSLSLRRSGAHISRAGPGLLAAGAFSLRSGQSRTVRAKLSRAGIKAIARRAHGLAALLGVSLRGNGAGHPHEVAVKLLRSRR